MDRLESYTPMISRPSKRRLKSDRKFSEVAIFELNKSLIASGDTRKWLELLNTLAECRSKQIKEFRPKIPQTVDALPDLTCELSHAALFSDDLRWIYVFLVLLGKNRYICGKVQDAVRILEAAKAIPCSFPLDFAIIMDITLAWCYKAIGNSRKCALLCETYAPLIKNPLGDMIPVADDEFSADAWEQDLFGRSNSRAVALNRTLDGAAVAARFFKAGEIIYIDKPVVGYVANSQLQCNHCTMKSLHLVPCFTCRLVCYCSLACMEKDAHYHQFECTGYRLLFFPLVFGVLELRMLVKAMDILDHVLNSKPTVLSTSDPAAAAPSKDGPAFAQQLWDVLLKGREEFPDFFQILLGVKLNYSDLPVEDHQALVLKARMLVQYLQYTGLLQKKYPTILARASIENQWDMFLASLLLRFSMLTTHRSSTFSYILSFDEQSKQQVMKATKLCSSLGSNGKNLHQCIMPSLVPLVRKLELKSWDECDAIEIEKFLEDAMSEIAKRDQSLDNPPNRTEKKSSEQVSIENEEFCRDRDSLAELWDEATLEAAQNCQEEDIIRKALQLYAEKYVCRNRFTNTPHCGFTLSNQYYGMYRSSVELKHSFTPNTTAVLLTHGVVGIYASSDIEKGEPLTMSYGKAAANKQHRPAEASYNGVRCKKCRFNVNPPRDACHCEPTPLEGPICTLVQQLSNIEDNHVIYLTSKVDAENPCVSLQHFERLWNSIFASEFNPKTYHNRKQQLQALNDHADFDTGNAHNICRTVLYLVHAITSHSREVFKPNSLARLQELMFVMKNTISLFIRRKCPDSVIGSVLNIFKQIEDVCREAQTIANVWMEYQQLAELVTLRGLLDRTKQHLIHRFAANL